MYKSCVTFLIVIFLAFACKIPYSSIPLKVSSAGIAAEIRDTSIKDENHYSHDNKIYKVGRIFIYDYYYQDKSGNRYQMKLDKSLETIEKKWSELKVDSGYKGWVFTSTTDDDTNVVKKVKVTVRSGGLEGFQKMDPNYTQTIIRYDLMIHNGNSEARGYWEGTGVIENKKNLWVHPPRNKFFEILEINPFPYIKAPYKIGHSWTWELSIGNHWSDRRWLIWEGRNLHTYKYTITAKVSLKTKLGDLKCYVVESESNSKIGTTRLTAYFNKKYGFVKLDYTNIDGTKTVMDLEKVE